MWVQKCALCFSKVRAEAEGSAARFDASPALARAFAVILFMGFVALNTKAQHTVHLMIESDFV